MKKNNSFDDFEKQTKFDTFLDNPLQEDVKQNELFVEPLVIKYLNRLSDYLFTLARFISHTNGAQELAWKPRL